MKTQTISKKILAAVLALAMVITTFVPVRQVAADTTLEPGAANITFDTASDLVFDTTLTDDLSSTDRERYYKFSLSEPSILRLRLESLRWINITIYDKYKTECYSSHVYDRSDTWKIYLTGGEYCLGMGLSSTESTGSYTMFATLESLGDSFQETYDANNDIMETADEITVGKQYIGALAEKDDKDYYKFTLADSSNVTLIIADSTTASLAYTIYDSYGDKLSSADTYFTSKVDKTIQLEAGTYYLLIEKYGSSNGIYTFSLSATKIVEKPQATKKPSTTTNKQTTTTKKVTKPKKVTIKKVKNPSASAISVKWKKLSGVSGYQVQISNKKNFKKLAFSRNVSSATVDITNYGYSRKKTYYVRIRAYATANGVTKYGAWSAKKKIKVKK